jgi:hypothetical protein
MPTPESSLLEQLSANSIPYRDPLAVLDWRMLDLDSYWLPPEAVSLHGLPEFEALSNPARMRLSQYEFLGIAQVCVALERVALESAARRLRHAQSSAEYAYLLHEMREEAGHSLMFLRLASASGLEVPDWQNALPRFARPVTRLVPSDTLYWFMRVVVQDVPDKLHRFMRRHAGTDLNPFVRQAISLRMIDQSRHLAYARRQLELAVQETNRAGARMLPVLCDSLFNRYVRRLFWPRPDLYERAGLGEGRAWRHAALRNPQRREFVLKLLAPTMRLLQQHGISVRLR